VQNEKNLFLVRRGKKKRKVCKPGSVFPDNTEEAVIYLAPKKWSIERPTRGNKNGQLSPEINRKSLLLGLAPDRVYQLPFRGTVGSYPAFSHLTL